VTQFLTTKVTKNTKISKTRADVYRLFPLFGAQRALALLQKPVFCTTQHLEFLYNLQLFCMASYERAGHSKIGFACRLQTSCDKLTGYSSDKN